MNNQFTPINNALERLEDAINESPFNMWKSYHESKPIFERRELVVIGAAPAMGKTSLMLSIAKEFAVEKDCPIAIISTNQSTSYLAMRLLSIVCVYDVPKMYYDSQTEFKERMNLIEEGNKILNCAPIYLKTICGNIDEMLSDMRSLVAEKGIKYVLVENINDLYWPGGRHFETKEDGEFGIVRKLKLFAQELNICIIAAYTMRYPANRRRKKMILNDFPFGKDILRYATVMLLHRPEYYRILEDKQGKDLRGTAYLTIINNHTQTEISLKFENFTRFTVINGDFPYLAKHSTDDAVTGKLAKELSKAVIERDPAIDLLKSILG